MLEARTSGAQTASIGAGRDIFEHSPIFGTLSSSSRALLSKAVHHTRVQHQGVVYFQDDDAEHLYCIISGHVRLTYIMDDGSTVLHDILAPGNFFGELGVFDRSVHADTATAAGDVVLATIAMRVFHSSDDRHADIRHALSTLIATRYRSYIEVTRNLSLGSLSARLSQALLRLADSLGEPDAGDSDCTVIGSVVTQSDLGAMARGTRGNVNRCLKSWEQSGWISVQNRRIYIRDRNALEMLAFDSNI